MYQPFQLQVEQLICVQQERPLFKPLSFTLQNRQILLLHGPNGIGKTTCLRTLAGLLIPARGNIIWNQEKTHYNPAYLSNLAYLGHHVGIKLALTPHENLQVYLTLIDQEQQNTLIPRALAHVNLSAKTHTACGQLSAGQQRRVALARLWLAKLPLWILDEPLTALDTQGMGLLQQLLREHIQQGGAAVLTSHQYFAAASHTMEMEAWKTC